MEVSAQLHALAALPLKEKKEDADCAPGPVWALRRRGNPIASVKNGTTIPKLPGHNLVTMLNELSELSHWNREFVSIINAV